MYSPSKIPATKASHKEFREFLRAIGYEIEHTLGMYAQEHRSRAMTARSTGYGGKATEFPDEQELAISASTFFGMMFATLDQIMEAEQRLEFLDDVDEDSEEYHHAQGELFGAKTIFISIAQKFSEIETERIASTGYGEKPKKFLHSMIRGEGNIKGEPITPEVATGGWYTNPLTAYDLSVARGGVTYQPSPDLLKSLGI